MSASSSHVDERAAAIRQELERVCTSKLFAKSSIAPRMLRYLVEQELAGRWREMKEITVAIELFGTEPGYDPRLDSVVRVNATRLRVRLEQYYRQHPADRVRIIIDKGSYIATYEWIPQQEVLAGPGELRTSSSQLPTEILLPTSPASARRYWWFSAAGLALCGCLFVAYFIAHLSPRASEASDGRRVHPFGGSSDKKEFAEYSPDGQTVAFVAETGDHGRKAIYLQGLNSDKPTRLTNDTYSEGRPSWSPDGKQLAYLRLLKANSKQVIVRMLKSGGETVAADLYGGPLWLCGIPHLSWSIDGGHLYTSASNAANAPCGVVSINLESHAVQSQVRTPEGNAGDLEPAVSPDGRSLAFIRNFGYLSSDIFLQNLTSGNVTQISHDTSDLLGFAWNKDGKSLIVASNRVDGERRLWAMPLDGGEPRPLTDGASEPSFPSVAVNGGRILFTQFHMVSNIWKTDRTGSIKVIDNGGANRDPDISPQGSLAFTSDRSGIKTIWLSDADGQNAHRLLRDTSIVSSKPKWSPDGSQIVFQCEKNGTNICMTDTQGTTVKVLTQGPSDHTAPSWSRDGKSIYYTWNRLGIEQVYRQELGSGLPEKITIAGGDKGTESANGQLVLFRRPGSMMGIEATPISTDVSIASRQRIQDYLQAIPKRIPEWQVFGKGLLYVDTEDRGVSPMLTEYSEEGQFHKLFRLEGYEGAESPAFTYDNAQQAAYYAKVVYKIELSVLDYKAFAFSRRMRCRTYKTVPADRCQF